MKNIKNQDGFFEELLSQIPGDVAVFDHLGRYVYVNSVAIKDEKIREWIIGKTDMDYCIYKQLPIEKAKVRMEFIKKVAENGVPIKFEEKIIDETGNEKHYLRHVKPFFNQDGRSKYLLGYGVEITDVKMLRIKLDDSLNFVDKVLDSSPHLIFVKDNEGRFLLVNKAVSDLFNMTKEELINQSNADVHDNKEEVLEYNRIDRLVLSTNQPVRREEVFSKPNGDVIYFDSIKVPLTNSGLNNTVLGISTDITDRKLKENLLALNEQRMIVAQKLIKAGNWDIALKDKSIDWSEGMYSIWERELNLPPLSNEEFKNSIHEDDVDRVMAIYFNMKNEKDIVETTYRINVPTGLKHVRTLSKTVFDENKQPIRIFGTVIDITDQIKTEHILRQNQKRLNEAQLLAKVGSYDFDLISGKIDWSEGVYHIWKRPINLPPPTYEEFLTTVHPDDLEQIQSDEQSMYLRKESYSTFYRIICPDGEIKHLSVVTKLRHDANGKLIKVFGTVIDESERKRSEELLQINQNRLIEAQEMAKLGSWQLDLRTNLIEWSIGSYKIWERDLKKSNPTMQEIIDSIYPEDQHLIDIAQVYAIKDKTDFNIEYRITTELGNKKIINGRGRAMLDESGTPYLLFGTVLDITERKQFEQELMTAKIQAQESVRTKEYFLANIGHELRTPLNGILGMARLLQKTEINITQRSYIDVLNTTAGNLLVIINDILDIAKIESGTMSLESIVFDPAQVADTAFQVQLFKAEEKDLSLRHLSIGGPMNKVIGDPYRLNQILLNLLSNAVKFTDVGEIILQHKIINEDNDSVTIEFSVSDTGIGIPEDMLQSIFISFKQLNAISNNRLGGTGLGLSISKNLVEMQGGKIIVSSKVGVGSIFSFSIKYKKAINEELSDSEINVIASDELGPIRILLAEDNRVNQYIAEAMLQDWGFIVDVANNGKEAVDLFDKKEYDLVLMDIQMPELNGIEATRIIRKSKDAKKSNVPIIALTANTTKQVQRNFVLEGMNDFLVKPFKEETLYKKILAQFIGNDQLDKSFRRKYPTRKRPLPSKESLYNLSLLRDDARDNPAFIKRMLTIFIETIPPLVEKMIEHYDKGEMDAVSTIAHKIKPTLDGAGILSLRETIRNIENYRDKKRTPESLKSDIDQLKNIIDVVVIEFMKELNLLNDH